MSKLKESKKPSHISDEGKRKRGKRAAGKEGLKRLADFTRRILRAGKVEKQTG